MKNQKLINFKSGQTMVMLIIFVIVSITITVASTAILITNSLTATKFQEGLITYHIAESGIENAMMRLLRDPNYTGTGYCSGSGCTPEPVLTVGTGTVNTTVTASGACQPSLTITSTATSGNFVRKIQACVSYVNNILIVSSWREIF